MKLTIDHIAKRYGGRAVLADASCAFESGATSVLMGPNGSGKSTLLRICALLERPDSGVMTFEDRGTPLPHDLLLRRRITLVLPRVGLFNTTVSGNVSYGLRIRGVQRPERDRLVQEALAFVGLEDTAGQPARTLSSGEAQRLGIARALALRPEVLLLDEPTASVDEENTGIIEDIIMRMQRVQRTTIILSTHDREQAARLGDELLVLRNGSVGPRRA